MPWEFKYRLMCLLFVICSSVQAKNKDTTKFIGFQKLANENRLVRYELPQKCRIYLGEDEKRFGKIVDMKDSIVLFEYKDYDTSDVNAILNADLKRKERDAKIDSLIDSSKVIQIIPLDSLTKIAILSRDAKIGRKIGMLAASLTFMTSGAILMNRQSNNVGSTFQYADWGLIGVMVGSTATVAALSRKIFDFEKWKLVKM